MGVQALGRVFNVQYAMDGVYVNMRDAGGVAFLCYLGAGDTYTVTEAQDAAGTGAAVLVTITDYYECTGAGLTAWTHTTQAAASTMVLAGGAGHTFGVIQIDEAELSAGFDWVKCTSTGAGIVLALTYNLKVQRAPANLPAMGA